MSERFCMNRRQMLLAGAGTTLWVSLGLPGRALAEVAAKQVAYDKKKIAKLSALKEGKLVQFLYPDDDKTYGKCMLIKLGVPAHGGVGPNKDIVAFSALCTHMGGILSGSYNHEYRLAGPCPTHLTTFDLTRHGMVVAGHATESLPQITLAIEGDDVVANGVLGLMYGRSRNA